ncbi:hypothetical protein PG985_000355 [Apiospora marii]|uniref:uncharacterized protein n=1 Tax=Apiospora marii TaxID=335849 RepID=UPI00312F1E78
MGSVPVDISTREKYLIENAKRAAAADNFAKRIDVQKDSSLHDLLRDPWADYAALAQQEPWLKDGSHTKFVVFGAGHAGLIHAYHLIKAGFDTKDIVLVDNAGGWGGTWYWNRYPGLQCDVEGYCYLPLLEESGFVPTHRYSHGEEIRQNAEHIAAKFGLQGMFCTTFVGATWNDSEARWDIKLRRNLGPDYEHLNGEFAISAQFIINTTGVLANMSIPALPGIEEFRKEKKLFHAARWDYEYTGGSYKDPKMTKLQDKVVGIVGTAATAVQAVPELAKWAKHLYVFQRTPIYVGPHQDSETTPGLRAKHERQENLSLFFTDDASVTPDMNLVDDERSRYPSLSGIWGSRRAQDLSGKDQAAEHTEWMLQREAPHAARLREHIRRTVRDPATAEKLTPWYPGWCKRPAFHNAYLQAFDRPNVTLVDTDGRGVEAYTRQGVVVGRDEYPLDALVLATGFEIAGTGQSPTAAAHAYCRGRGGRDLDDKWGSLDFGTLLGVCTHGFPNLFFSVGANSGANANMTAVYTSQARMTAHLVATSTATARNSGGDPARTVVEATVEGERGWVDECLGLATWYVPLLTTCPPTYFTGYRNGPPDEKTMAVAKRKLPYPGGPVGFDEAVSRYIAEGDLKGVVVVK